MMARLGGGRFLPQAGPLVIAVLPSSLLTSVRERTRCQWQPPTARGREPRDWDTSGTGG